jgi:hypothetical protein
VCIHYHRYTSSNYLQAKKIKRMTFTNIIGDCRNENLIEQIFGSVSAFACVIEEYGDSFTYGNVNVTYDDNLDRHTFHNIL